MSKFGLRFPCCCPNAFGVSGRLVAAISKTIVMSRGRNALLGDSDVIRIRGSCSTQFWEPTCNVMTLLSYPYYVVENSVQLGAMAYVPGSVERPTICEPR